MNKADLLDALEGRLGSRKVAADAVEAIVDVIIREVAKGGSVGITGFGTFEPAARAARTGRNPRTGETVRIDETTVPKFRPGTQFKEVVADPTRLPTVGVAGARANSASARGAGAASTGDRQAATSSKGGRSAAKGAAARTAAGAGESTPRTVARPSGGTKGAKVATPRPAAKKGSSKKK